MRKAGPREGRRTERHKPRNRKDGGDMYGPKVGSPTGQCTVMGEQQEDVQTPRKENGNDNGRERSERVMSGGGKNGKVDSGIGGAKK